MKKYYGVMCCEIDGSLEDLEVWADSKPAHEQSGFFFAKWTDSKEKRDRLKEYLKNAIEKKRNVVKDVL
jgi:hypothetical protein